MYVITSLAYTHNVGLLLCVNPEEIKVEISK